MPPRRSLIVGALLTALVALGQISTSIYVPSLPAIVVDLSATQSQVNLTLSGFLAGFAVCQLVFGPFSDRWGRRPTLIAGLSLYLVASLWCVLAPSIGMLIAGRVLQGMAACVGPVLGRAIVRDIYGPDGTAKAMAMISAALAVSPAVAPMIGGYLDVWFGWRSTFIFLSGVGVLILGVTLWLLAETRPLRKHGHPGSAGLLAASRQLLSNRTYLGYTIAVACIFAGLMAFAAAGPFIFIEVIGLAPQHYGMLAVFTVAGYLAGTLLAGRLAERMAHDRLVLLGLAGSLAGAIGTAAMAAAMAPSVIAVVAPMALFTAGLGIVLPVAMAAAMAPFPLIAGSASALLGFVQMLVAAVASFVVGVLPHFSALPMGIVILACTLMALFSFVILARPQTQDRPPG
ncbi:MAG: multidrug effflux MFS transporter [Rhodospirillales bacterium]|nr:multidrug effflux MFS transporter [Rhodospirillales bacterium]